MSETTCTNCGCTDLRACPGGCSWLGVNHEDGTGVCSNCPKALTAWRAQQVEAELDAEAAAEYGDDDDDLPPDAAVGAQLAGRVQIGPTDI